MQNPYEGINFTKRLAVIHDSEGNEIFNKVVEFPDYFDDASVKIIASKYLCNSSKRQELSIKDMVNRVAETIGKWGSEGNYFPSNVERDVFINKLKYYQIHQFFAFNSPMYFNCGLSEVPQLSACFILDVEDSMDSITKWISTEARVFKYGSGAGVNLSKIRSSKEKVRQGGHASGPVSFLKGADTLAGVIKSGGTFRRSAKLACLNIDHPDISNFIICKDKEEEKLRAIKSAGIKSEKGYELSDEVFFQNTNISVRMSDNFMHAVKNGDKWFTREVLTGEPVDEFDAKELLMHIAEHAWQTGDPGVMYHDNTNKWNSTISDGEIVSSNPCAEFVAQPNQSCNLASVNLMKFFDDSGFNAKLYEDVIKTVIIAQDIVIDRAFYPTELITEQTRKYRALGLGYTNLGALCMYLGFPYDSQNARTLTALLTATLTGIAHSTSNKLAKVVGPGLWWKSDDNKSTMNNVLKLHYVHITKIDTCSDSFFNTLKEQCIAIWDTLKPSSNEICVPLRNSQVSLLAPTGTTSFLMGADTFGCEPDFSILKFKRLSGNDGAMIKTVNGTVHNALQRLGYDEKIIHKIVSDLMDNDIPIEKSKHVKPEHIAIFDTAIPPANGTRCIDYMGHIKMLCAIQPFISGAISKTINMASTCTVQDIFDLYLYAWERGLKSLTIYRDGSKTEQVLTNKKQVSDAVTPVEFSKIERKRMPFERTGKTHKFIINGNVKGYLTHNTYDDGTLGEFFVKIAKDGSTLAGLTDGLATITSIALQYGVPLEDIVKKMINRKFEPNGFTKNPDIRVCASLIDYMFKFLAIRYLDDEKLQTLGIKCDSSNVTKGDFKFNMNASPCPECGAIMKRLGSCEQCSECGFSGGSCG